MEEEKSGITLKDIFRVIFSQKWLALLVAIIVAVICVFVLYFGYGPSKTEYVSSFTVNMATDKDGNTVYPDGRVFEYRQLVSRENLKAVKESSNAFKSVDLDGLNISVSQNAKAEGETKTVYTLRVKASAFASKRVAADFVTAVANACEYRIKEYIAFYGASIADGYNSKNGYEIKLEYLTSALSSVEDKLKDLSGDFTAELAEADALHYEASLLKNELYTAKYESDAKALQNAVYYVKELQLELEQVNEALNNLISMGEAGAAGTTVVINGADKIAYYSERKVELEKKIKYYEDILSDYKSENAYNIPESLEKKDGEEAFAAKLDGLQVSLRTLAEDALTCEYLEKSSVIVFDGDVVTKVGATGLMTSLVIGVVAGVVVAAVVAYIVGWNKLKKEQSGQPALQTEENTAEEKEEAVACADEQDGAEK